MSPPPRTSPDAGPWGDARDLEACRAAVERADGRGRGALLALLFAMAAAGLVATGLFVAATVWLPNWLKGPSLTSALGGPPLVKKTAAPKVGPPRPPVLPGAAAGLPASIKELK